MGQLAPLKKNEIVVGTAKIEKPTSIEERVEVLEKSFEAIMEAYVSSSETLKSLLVKSVDDDTGGDTAEVNSDGIPINTSLIGMTTNHPNGPLILTVSKDGYFVGVRKFDSLSAAAEAVSGVRRSGWVFWRLPDGRTAKEVYGK